MQTLQKLFLSENLDLFTSTEDLHKLYNYHIYNEDNYKKIWTVEHKFNSKNVIVQVIDNNSEVIIPDKVTLLNPNTLQISFSEAITGKALIYGPPTPKIINLVGELIELLPPETNILETILEIDEVPILDDPDLTPEITQLFSNLPILKNIFIDEDLNRFLSNKELHYKSRYLLFRADDADTEWLINHNFSSFNIYLEIFDKDTNETIIPESNVLLDSNNLLITFEEPQKGYVIIVAPIAESRNYFIPILP